jgi:hypothetical protein
VKWITLATLFLVAADAMAQTLPRYEIIPSYQAIYPTPTLGARYAALKIDRVANKNYLCTVHFDKATDLSKPQRAECRAHDFPNARDVAVATVPYVFPYFNSSAEHDIHLPSAAYWTVNITNGAVGFCIIHTGRCWNVP